MPAWVYLPFAFVTTALGAFMWSVVLAPPPAIVPTTPTPFMTVEPNFDVRVANMVLEGLYTPTDVPPTPKSTKTPSAADKLLLSLPYCTRLTPTDTPVACVPYSSTPKVTPLPTSTELPTPTVTPMNVCLPEMYGPYADKPCLLMKLPEGWTPTPTATTGVSERGPPYGN